MLYCLLFVFAPSARDVFSGNARNEDTSLVSVPRELEAKTARITCMSNTSCFTFPHTLCTHALIVRLCVSTCICANVCADVFAEIPHVFVSCVSE